MSCSRVENSGSVCTRIATGWLVRSSFLGVPLSGWKTYSYLWSGLAVKSSHTKLCTGWREVFTLVLSSGLGTSEGKTLKPKA